MNGIDLFTDECGNCAQSDCTDETHAILEGEIFNTVKMTSLARDLDKPTQEDKRLWYMGPIDNLYVLEGSKSDFLNAETPDYQYGSSHWPIFTVLRP